MASNQLSASVPLSEADTAVVVESLMNARNAVDLKSVWNRWSKSLDEKIRFEGELLTIRTAVVLLNERLD